MAYKVMSDELYEKSSDSSKKGPKKDSKKKININPLYIHIGILVIILLSLILFFSSSISFDFSKDEVEIVTLVGNLEQFNKTYQGNISIYSKQSILETTNAKIDESSKDFYIDGFVGTISLADNISMVIEGVAQKIDYGKNTLNLKGSHFKLQSFKKTNVALLFENLDLKFIDGRIKVADALNYEFENSTIILNNYNTTLSYDGMFSFSGPVDGFTLKNSNSNNIQITYEAPQTQSKNESNS